MTATIIETPVGDLAAISDGAALTTLAFPGGSPVARVDEDTVLSETRRQLGEYFAGERTSFDLPLRPHGSPWQRIVWDELLTIPYGETTSYGELAARLGRPSAARAVGLANGSNPIAIVIPCHRVIGADGTLTGYGGGLERKRTLLDLESGWFALTA